MFNFPPRGISRRVGSFSVTLENQLIFTPIFGESRPHTQLRVLAGTNIVSARSEGSIEGPQVKISGRVAQLQLAGHRFQNHLLNLHHPLQFCGWELLFDGFHIIQLFPPAFKRTFHLLIEADNSHANDTKRSSD